MGTTPQRAELRDGSAYPALFRPADTRRGRRGALLRGTHAHRLRSSAGTLSHAFGRALADADTGRAQRGATGFGPAGRDTGPGAIRGSERRAQPRALRGRGLRGSRRSRGAGPQRCSVLT
jgi:hypothetical protein